MRFLTPWPGRVLVTTLLLLAVGDGYVYLDQQLVQVLRIGTFGAGNISHTVSQALAKVAAREYPRLRLEIVETKGAVDNMRLLHEGKVDLAFAQSDIPAVPEARLVADVHPQLFHLIVRSDSSIRSVADLKGKRVGTPGKGGGSYNAFVVLMKHYDLAQLVTAERKLLAMFRQVVEAKDQGELESDSLEPFVLTWNQALRYRQLVLERATA